MNWGLLRSYHALVCLLLLGLFLGVFALEGWPLEVNGVFPSRTLRVGSGIVCLLLLVGVGAYVLRKYAHRGGYSPEFRLRVAYQAIEVGNRALIALQAKIDRGSLVTEKEILREAKRALAKAGSQRINKAVVERDASGALTVKVMPTEPLGRVAHWLHVHVWYGWLFGPAVLLHAGLQWPSSIGQTLVVLVAIVWLSGLVGIVFWAKGPSYLTQQERDLSIEEAYSLNSALTRKTDLALASLPKQTRATIKRALCAGEALDESLWPQLDGLPEAPSRADLYTLFGQFSNIRKELQRLRRARWWIMGWKLIHVPAAVILAFVTLSHVISVLTY